MDTMYLNLMFINPSGPPPPPPLQKNPGSAPETLYRWPSTLGNSCVAEQVPFLLTCQGRSQTSKMEEAKSVGLSCSILTAKFCVSLHSGIFASLPQNERRRPPRLPQPGYVRPCLSYLSFVPVCLTVNCHASRLGRPTN